MNENFLTFLWKNRYIPESFETIEGYKIKVVDYGLSSFDAGPDFINVKLLIDNKLWVGSVEMHRRSSDWFRHNHNSDPAFENVILHVVYEADRPVFRPNGERIPTLEYDPDPLLVSSYNDLINQNDTVKCTKQLEIIPSHVTSSWFDSLLVERLEQRAQQIIQEFNQTQHDWEQVFFQQLAKALGMRVNAQPMLMLARSLQYKILKRYVDQIDVLEAILFGQAGFLENNFDDEYYRRLKQLFFHYKKKYNLEPLEQRIWKFMRLRPYNFPTIRIAQLAAILSQTDHLFSQILELSLSSLLKILRVKASDYWDNHYTFTRTSNPKAKIIGTSALQSLIINAVVPVLYTYGKASTEDKYINKALDFLHELRFENNYITRRFKKLKTNHHSAADSQAIIQLYKNYCQQNKCLDCRFASYIIKSYSRSS